MTNLVAAFLLTALAGCAVLHPGAEQPVAADAIMSEALNAARAPQAEQKATLSRAQQRFLKDPTVLNRLRLGTLLAALPAPLRDDVHAAELLEPIADPGAPGPGRFAALLLGQVNERVRLVREIARERDRTEKERDRSDKERDKREEGLRQQLEALRSIERGILEREERLRKRQR